MRKLIMLVIGLIMTVAANAQFEEGKYYVAGSLTGLNMSYNGAEDFNFGVQAKGGYMLADNWMALAFAGYQHEGKGSTNAFNGGVGARYYIIQNGLYMGVNGTVVLSDGYNDIKPGIELGYAFFINGSVTIEPAIYYDQSLKCHKDYSTVGMRIGIGVYL